jgi:DNA-binding transcriptional MerR regulator
MITPAMLLDVDAAAKQLKISPRTLERWRLEGRGPDFVRVGKRRLYTPEALREFIAANTVRMETD